ncbi:MAG: hypothetical protein IT204_09770 [Fimbriimonadaceae bacterium]|nr:hypothetical protein [Fimbriimonadaceae bacterium]
MASSVATADLRRDKIRLAVYALVFVICALICFKPIRLIDEKTFSDVYFTFRYEQSFGTSDRAKDELRAALSSKFASWNLPADCDVSFPAANDLKVKVPAKDAAEAAEFKKQILKLLDKELGTKYGKQVGEPREDLSGFPDQPLAKLGPLGIFRPRLHMKLGLDIQGGVHLVLQARTQNVQYEFKLAQTPAELRAALAAAAGTAPAEPAEEAAKDAKAEPAKEEAKDAKAEPAKEEAKDAKAEPAKEEAKDAKAGTEGKQPDGGEPIRIAQAPPAEGTAPVKGAEPVEDADSKSSEAKDAAPAAGGETAKDAEPTTLTEEEVTSEDAVAWADEALMEQVESRINEIVVQIKQKYAERDGQVMAEVVSSQTVVFRTRVEMSEAQAQQQMAEHARMILG